MRWGEKETLKFVNIYLKHECLWNPNDPGYKFRIKRQEAYKNIISVFHSATGIRMDELELKSKIKNLRSTYSQEVTKIKQRSNHDYVYTPNMKWFNDWHRCFQTIKSSGDQQEHEAIDDSNHNSWVQQNDMDDKGAPLVTQSDSYVLLKVEADDHLSQRDLNTDTENRKKIKHSSPDNSNIDSTFDNNMKEDEFDIYGRYIATQLRSMDLQRALRVQLEIHSIVSEARMASLTGN